MDYQGVGLDSFDCTYMQSMLITLTNNIVIINCNNNIGRAYHCNVHTLHAPLCMHTILTTTYIRVFNDTLRTYNHKIYT